LLLGCDFFRKYADTQIHIKNRQKPLFSDAGHCFQMVSNDYFLFFCDFAVMQIRRYADTQIGVPASLPLMHASSLKESSVK